MRMSRRIKASYAPQRVAAVLGGITDWANVGSERSLRREPSGGLIYEFRGEPVVGLSPGRSLLVFHWSTIRDRATISAMNEGAQIFGFDAKVSSVKGMMQVRFPGRIFRETNDVVMIELVDLHNSAHADRAWLPS